MTDLPPTTIKVGDPVQRWVAPNGSVTDEPQIEARQSIWRVSWQKRGDRK